jgi:hypothetical protein
MYDNTPPRWANLACFNRFVFLCLLLITVPWVLYVVLTPLDSAVNGLDLLWRRLVDYSLVIAWVSVFALHGLVWLVERLQ